MQYSPNNKTASLTFRGKTMTSYYQYPAINLRMKWTSGETTKDVPTDLLTDQIDAMMELNRRYQCGDYLLYQTSQQQLQPQQDDADGDGDDQEDLLDSLARKKMIDWKFRVVDHYNISREIVATSTNLMDRFVYQCHCDRMTFKLAAMTSLYMAAKVHNHNDHHQQQQHTAPHPHPHHQLPITKLVELSRGEFVAQDIIEMETMILQTLSWRVNPVTVHSFIHSLVQLVPVSNTSVIATIYDRAIFFAELCLFDYSYVTKSRATVAVAAILNALEGIGEGLTTEDSEQAFLETLQVHTSLDFNSIADLDHLREDLWYVYSMSAQYQEDDMQMFPTEMSPHYEKQHPTVMHNDSIMIAHSPVSVLSR